MFYDDVREFAAKADLIKAGIPNEEATKMSLIIPLFKIMGYDVFNPAEFCPEYTADVGIKRGEKVDYAILRDGRPMILIEAKAVTKSLEKQDSQLFRYFTTTEAKFAILTNGILYRFYTDLAEPNKMDKTPFLELNLLDLSDEEIQELEKFCKKNFDAAAIYENAPVLKYSALFREEVKKQLEQPNDDFVRLFLKSAGYKGVKTQNTVDRFRPVLKKALTEYIGSVVETQLTSKTNSDKPSQDKPKSSDRELQTLAIIRTLLSDLVDSTDLTAKKTTSYLAVLYQNNTRKWIARITHRNNQLTLIVPDQDKAEIKYTLTRPEDAEQYKDCITEVLKRYLPNDQKEYLVTKWGTYEMPQSYTIQLEYGPRADAIPIE